MAWKQMGDVWGDLAMVLGQQATGQAGLWEQRKKRRSEENMAKVFATFLEKQGLVKPEQLREQSFAGVPSELIAGGPPGSMYSPVEGAEMRKFQLPAYKQEYTKAQPPEYKGKPKMKAEQMAFLAQFLKPPVKRQRTTGKTPLDYEVMVIDDLRAEYEMLAAKGKLLYKKEEKEEHERKLQLIQDRMDNQYKKIKKRYDIGPEAITPGVTLKSLKSKYGLK